MYTLHILKTKKNNTVAIQHDDIGAGGCWGTQGVENRNPHAN